MKTTLAQREAQSLFSDAREAPSEPFFEREVWSEPLAKFASASGLTIGLYDADLRRHCGVTTASPIGDRLVQAGFWLEEGLGTAIDQAAVCECLKTSKIVYSVQLETFAHLAIPILEDEEVFAVFVIGWLPERFADPVNCDTIAKRLGIPQMEIWQLMRMQQPISKEKLETHARMLETFASPLIRQLRLQREDRRRAERASIVAETAQAFAQATTERQICAAAISSLLRLIRATAISIDIVRSKIQSEVSNYAHADSALTLTALTTSTFRSHLTIPIPAPQGAPLGSIEITIGEVHPSQESLSDLQLIASQMGVALQKVNLIQAIESERSALQTMNVQLEHLHKMKDEFLATVSHELRTPLGAILGWSQILLDEGPNCPDFPDAMATIERNAKAQSHLIEDLLDVSRIISGKMSLERENLDAAELLRQTLQTVFPMTEARRQKLHLQISSARLPFKGDATRITQVFWNLLSNASKFTPEGGEISVVLESAGHYIKLQITDSGKGISSEFLPHLFDRFSQADGSHTRRHGGLGLGLAIVRHLVELHGGTVVATSEGEGRGATFTVFIPRNASDTELDSAQTLAHFGGAPAALTPLNRLSDVKVLIVDDEPDSLRLTRFVLEKSGASVIMADNTEEAFAKYLEWKPDILVSDLSMPEESGFQLIAKIRDLPPEQGGARPAIALTALAGEEQRDQAISAGFNLHIAKPFEPNKLCLSIEALLEKRPDLNH